MALPQIIASYSHGSDTGAASVNVPNVQVDDWILACSGTIYVLDDTDVTFGGTGAGSWQYIGAKLGNQGDPVYENCGMVTAIKQATGTGTYSVTTTGPTAEDVLMVLHLRGCSGVHGSPVETVVAQNSANNVVDLGSLTTTEDSVLLVAFYGLAQFSGAQTWTPPSGMIEQADVSAPNTFATFGSATQEMASAGSSGTKSATSSLSGSAYGEAGKLIAIAGVSAPVTFPTRFFLVG